MKINALVIGVALGLSTIAIDVMSAELDSDALSATISHAEQDPAQLTSQLLAAHPDELLEVLTLLLQLKTDAAQVILTQAMTDYPASAAQFAALAKLLGISNEVITIAAIDAGLDPTQLAEQTAAGNSVSSPTPIAPSSKAPVSRS